MEAPRKILVISPSCEGWPEWPVGMAYVLACLEDNGIEFDFIDVVTTPNWGLAVKKLLRQNQYYAVATGGMISFVKFYREIVTLIRELAPKVPVVLGGHIVKDGSNELIFDSIGVDYAILGEAEVSFPAFLAALRSGTKDFAGFTGVVYRNQAGEIVRNPHSRFKVAARNIIPAWHHFDCTYYVENCKFCFLGKHLRYFPIMSGRGCTGKCTFCSPSIGGFIKRPIEHVIEEIESLIKTYDFDNLCFLNEMFYPTAALVREFCTAYMKLPVRKTWFVQVRADIDLDVETLKLMKAAGCIALSAGIESGSDKILTAMHKGTSVEQIARLSRNCVQADMPLTGTFIIGYEGETEEDLKKTVDFLIKEDISSGESLLFMYQGTEIYKKAVRSGIIKDEEKQLEAISGELFRPTAPQEFCNMTAMAGDFFKIAPREVRRFNKHLYNKYRVADMQMEITNSWRWTEMHLKGRCPVCGIEVEHEYKVYGGEFLATLGQGVDRMVICPKCFKHLIFDVYAATNNMGMSDHLARIREKLSGAKKVALFGIGSNLHFLLRSDIFNLDYDTIVGVYSNTKVNYDHYLTYPILNDVQLCQSGADCVICTDDSTPAATIAGIYKARGHGVPDIIHLTSDEFRSAIFQKRCFTYRLNQISKRVLGHGIREILDALRIDL